MPNPIPQMGQKSVAVWFDKVDAKALQSRASHAGMSLPEYVADTMRKVASVEPGRIPVILDIESRDYRDLHDFTAKLLVDDDDADVDEQLLIHVGCACAHLAERARLRGSL
jgi:hypothetical protein